MKILTIHADFIEFEAKKKAFKGAEEGIKEGKQRVEECLVVFTAVEKRDEENITGIVERYVQEIKNVAVQVNAKNIVLYPYAHLSSALASPSIAEKVLKEAEKVLAEKYTVVRAPFGWYKAFNISCKGHPLSELSREFSVGNGKSETTIISKSVPPSEKMDRYANATYTKLLDFLDKNKATYQLLDHPPEGRTEIVSPMRGNKLSQAAKCIVVMVKKDRDERKYVLGVIPGDAKINLTAIKDLFRGTYASFATPDVAEELAGSVSGTILPFSFNPRLELVVDPRLLQNEELYFNAARLDRSLSLKTKDYVRLANPHLESIADYSEESIRNLKKESKDVLFEYSTKKLLKEERLHLSTCFLAAKAIKEKYPTAGIGEFGFHGDHAYVDLADVKLKNEDLPKLEQQMKAFLLQNLPFTVVSKGNTRDRWQLEIAKDINGDKPFYELDHLIVVPLFKDPFVRTTKEIGALKVVGIGSAYWKGNESNPQLTRLYCTGFENEEKLQHYVKLREEAENRSHLKIGKEQGLFVVSELVGAGMPLLAPKGVIIRNEIVKFLWELHQDKGYQQVLIPHLAKEELYKKSGHWEKFGDELFHVKGKYEQFVIKPMNCPHHIQIFDHFSYSYRDMPVRFFEPTTVYRDEKSGQLVGLSRVRAITQDDGHIFCRQSQIGQEVETIVEIILQFYKQFGMDKDYWVSLSVRGEDKSKYLGTEEVWNIAESSLEKVAKENKLPYKKIVGEAAFYGPKLDFMFKDALGREWQLATIQLDFNQPERFNLAFMNEESKKERPVMIHRAISGSLERFMSIVIEHFAGKFPLWLSPVQVKIVTVTDRNLEFAREVQQKMRKQNIRVELDDRAESMGKKIRDAQVEKVNYIVTIGDKEMEKKTVAIRGRDGKVRFDVPVKEFIEKLRKEIENKEI